jgi:hypothetical protein
VNQGTRRDSEKRTENIEGVAQDEKSKEQRKSALSNKKL